MKDLLLGIISAILGLGIALGTLGYIVVEEYNVTNHHSPIVYDMTAENDVINSVEGL